MANPENQRSNSEPNNDDQDRVGPADADDTGSSTTFNTSLTGVPISPASSDTMSGCSGLNSGSDNGAGLTERLADILVDEGDGDLLLQGSDRAETLLRWIRALDMQVIGACRADERLKPLLKLNVSGGAAEDRLLVYLSQHFEPSEVGLLTRCLCIPLVSIRVGKIDKQGTLLCPTAIRGNLNLFLLPTSDLRLSFVGDDGHTERLSTLSSRSQSSSVTIEEIAADKSGRSILIKLPDGRTFYFWCAEKSKLLGVELFEKMKDFLKRKPSLAELSGISESRLGNFASYLRTYLIGSKFTNMKASLVFSKMPSPVSSLNSPKPSQTAQSLSASLKLSRSQNNCSQGAKHSSSYQGSLSPRSSSFKEGLSRNLYPLRSVGRQKFRRRGDNHSLSADNLSIASLRTEDVSGSNYSEEDKHLEVSVSCLFPPSSFLESLGDSAVPCFPDALLQVSSIDSPVFSPYYCWCPPVASTLQYTVAPPQLPISSPELLSLPPLSSLLSVSRSSGLLSPNPPLTLDEIHSVDSPSLFPEPLARLPLSMPSSQQIPTFTPLMCDPIVHVPVIDVCLSGQGYLVSAGPAMPTTIPPLHPNLANTLIPQNDALVEQSARETLRLLISGSSCANPQLLDVFPSVLAEGDEKLNILAAGSSGLYLGVKDVDSIASSKAAMAMVSLSERSSGCSSMERCINKIEWINELQKPGCNGGSCSDGCGFTYPNSREERTD